MGHGSRADGCRADGSRADGSRADGSRIRRRWRGWASRSRRRRSRERKRRRRRRWPRWCWCGDGCRRRRSNGGSRHSARRAGRRNRRAALPWQLERRQSFIEKIVDFVGRRRQRPGSPGCFRRRRAEIRRRMPLAVIAPSTLLVSVFVSLLIRCCAQSPLPHVYCCDRSHHRHCYNATPPSDTPTTRSGASVHARCESIAHLRWHLSAAQ